MNFKNLTYAKLNLSFDKEMFINEYDKYIIPYTRPIANNLSTIELSKDLNVTWNMIDPEIYAKSDKYCQTGNANSMEYQKGEYPAWKMFQMMELDTTDISDPLLLKYAKIGSVALRNACLDKNFFLKAGYEKSEIAKWIFNNLPFKKIISIHCVSVEQGGFGTIHRDRKSLYDGGSSAGLNRLYQEGYIIINLNISNGGVPLFWSLDGDDAKVPRKADENVYLTNDYFMHGVPVCTSRRRQIRVAGIPEDNMWELFDPSTIVDIGPDYEYKQVFPVFPK